MRRHRRPFAGHYGSFEEGVSEVLVCYALRVYESPSTLQPNRVTS